MTELEQQLTATLDAMTAQVTQVSTVLESLSQRLSALEGSKGSGQPSQASAGRWRAWQAEQLELWLKEESGQFDLARAPTEDLLIRVRRAFPCCSTCPNSMLMKNSSGTSVFCRVLHREMLMKELPLECDGNPAEADNQKALQTALAAVEAAKTHNVKQRAERKPEYRADATALTWLGWTSQ